MPDRKWMVPVGGKIQHSVTVGKFSGTPQFAVCDMFIGMDGWRDPAGGERRCSRCLKVEEKEADRDA